MTVKAISYKVEFTTTEKEIIGKCYEVLASIATTMRDYNCNTLEGGDIECPEWLYLKDLDGVVDFLNCLYNDGIYKMY